MGKRGFVYKRELVKKVDYFKEMISVMANIIRRDRSCVCELKNEIEFLGYEKENLENEIQMIKDQVYQRKVNIAGRVYWPATTYTEARV